MEGPFRDPDIPDGERTACRCLVDGEHAGSGVLVVERAAQHDDVRKSPSRTYSPSQAGAERIGADAVGLGGLAVKQLAAFESGDGGSVVVEIDDSDPGYDRVARSGGELVADTGKQLGSALEVVRPTADALMEKVGQLAERPEKIEVQFGVRLNAQVGAVIASTQAEGHLQVTLTLTNPRSSASNGS